MKGVHGTGFLHEHPSAVDMYRQGYTVPEIAREYGVTRARAETVSDLRELRRAYGEAEWTDEAFAAHRAAHRENKRMLRHRDAILAAADRAVERLKRRACGGGPAYQQLECRCDKCRAYNAARNRDMRHVRAERVGNGEADILHGTANAYFNYMCRCVPCKQAGSEENRRRRERGRAA